jgi:hypothetical protein
LALARQHRPHHRSLRLNSYDPFTLAVLKAHVEMLERERIEFGPDYHDHGVLFRAVGVRQICR